jgi:hypothetical protein
MTFRDKVIHLLALVRRLLRRRPRPACHWQVQPGAVAFWFGHPPPAGPPWSGPCGSISALSEPANWHGGAAPATGDEVKFLGADDNSCSWVFQGGFLGKEVETTAGAGPSPAPPSTPAK